MTESPITTTVLGRPRCAGCSGTTERGHCQIATAPTTTTATTTTRTMARGREAGGVGGESHAISLPHPTMAEFAGRFRWGRAPAARRGLAQRAASANASPGRSATSG